MKHIFFDTNIIQHTINHNDKDSFLELHQLNIDFYSKSKIYLLPQIINELDEIKIDYKEGILGMVEVTKLDDFEDFNLQLIENIGKISLGVSSGLELKRITPFIVDAIFFFENAYGNHPSITLLKEIIGVDFNESHKDKTVGQALANLIENSFFGDETYHNLTYKDIFRCTGNFMYDYKKYLTKGERQKSKVGKDSLVFSEITFWANMLNIDIVKEDLIFITSDYKFFKELITFKTDILSGKIDSNEYFADLSPFFLSKLNEVFSKIKILKLQVDVPIFENEAGKRNRIIEELL